MAYPPVRKTFYYPTRNTKSGMGDSGYKLYTFDKLMIGLFLLIGGFTYWLYTAPEAKSAEKNPGGWDRWKKDFQKEFKKVYGASLSDYGLDVDRFIGLYFARLYPKQALEEFSRGAGVNFAPMQEKLRITEHQENPSKYYVKASRAEGLPAWTHGPYPLDSAKNYARIGSQTGRDRRVTRGESGPIIRRYSKGERTWPVTESQAQKLESFEVPKRL